MLLSIGILDLPNICLNWQVFYIASHSSVIDLGILCLSHSLSLKHHESCLSSCPIDSPLSVLDTTPKGRAQHEAVLDSIRLIGATSRCSCRCEFSFGHDSSLRQRYCLCHGSYSGIPGLWNPLPNCHRPLSGRDTAYTQLFDHSGQLWWYTCPERGIIPVFHRLSQCPHHCTMATALRLSDSFWRSHGSLGRVSINRHG